MNKKYQETNSYKKKKGILGLSIFIGIFALTIIFSFALAPLFTISYVQNKNVVSNTYYAVVLNNNITNYTDANEQAQTYRIRGGAGILLQENDYYHIIVFAYPTKADAEQIAQRLTTEENEFIVTEITINSSNNITKNSQSSYNTYFNFALSVLENLYTISNQIDSQEISDISANLQIKKLLIQANLYTQELFELKNEELDNIFAQITNIASILEYIANEEILESTLVPYSSSVRRAFVRILLSMQEL